MTIRLKELIEKEMLSEIQKKTLEVEKKTGRDKCASESDKSTFSFQYTGLNKNAFCFEERTGNS